MDKIICVGKNDLEHAQEMKKVAGDAVPDKPVLFLKPPSTIVQAKNGETIKVALPKGKGSIHHELELVCRIGGASHRIEAITVGLDMTLRDLQTEIKKKGGPWEVAKVFEGSAILGPWIEVAKIPNWESTEYSLSVDGAEKQKTTTKGLRLKPTECVSWAAEWFPMVDGDLIYTGTPKGVGPVSAGQTGEVRFGSVFSYKISWV